MARFVAGAVSMLLLLCSLLVVLVLVVREPGNAPPRPVDLGGGVRRGDAPTDLGPNETWLGDVVLTSTALVTPGGPLEDVHAVGTDVRVTTSGLRVGAVVLEAVLPFDVAAAQIGGGIDLFAAEGGRAGIERTTVVLGQTLRVRATGRVTAADGALVIEPETIDIGGPGFVNEALGYAARELVTIHHAVAGLPKGLRLTTVAVRPNGFAAHLTGSDVVIAGSSAPTTTPGS